MAEIKTKKNTASVTAFLNSVKDTRKREDAKKLLSIFKDATGMKPTMWGAAIVGYGSYHYKSERSSQEGDWMLTGFSPRAANLTIYIMAGAKKYAPLLKKLGKHTSSKGSCIYIKRLSDIDVPILKTIVRNSVRDMQKRHNGS